LKNKISEVNVFVDPSKPCCRL